MSDDEKVPQYSYGSAKPASHQPYRASPDRPPSQYWKRLRERVALWQEKHATEYAAIVVEARAYLELPPEGELRPAHAMVLDAVVVERVRVLKNWPDQTAWENNL